MIKLKVREVAEGLGWSPGRLMRATRLSNAGMYGIWNGVTIDPGIQTLGSIARAIGVAVCDLIEEDGVDVVVAPKDKSEDGPEWEEQASETIALTTGPSSLVRSPVLA